MEHPQLRRWLFHCFIIVTVRKFLLSLSLALLPQPAQWPSSSPQKPYRSPPPSPPQALQCCLGISPHLRSLGALSASGWGDHRVSAQRRVEGLPFPGPPSFEAAWLHQPHGAVTESVAPSLCLSQLSDTCAPDFSYLCSLLTIKTTTYS